MYVPSSAALEAIEDVKALGGDDVSAIINKAVEAHARWRKSAMKPAQRPQRAAVASGEARTAR